MARSMPPSKPRVRSVSRGRPAWSMRCCAVRCEKRCRRRAAMPPGRSGWPRASARHGPMMPKRPSPPAPRSRRCGCGSIAAGCRARPTPPNSPKPASGTSRWKGWTMRSASTPRCRWMRCPVSTPAKCRCRTAARSASPTRSTCPPARACSTPAPRPAARPRTWPSGIPMRASWRSMSMPGACGGWKEPSRGSVSTSPRAPPMPPRPTRGPKAKNSTPSSSMRPARRPASSAASRTCCCTGAKATSRSSPICRRGCSMRFGRC